MGVGQQLEPRRRGGKRGEDEQRVRVNSDGVGEGRSATSQSMAERTRLLATTFRGTRATTCASWLRPNVEHPVGDARGVGLEQHVGNGGGEAVLVVDLVGGHESHEDDVGGEVEVVLLRGVGRLLE